MLTIGEILMGLFLGFYFFLPVKEGIKVVALAPEKFKKVYPFVYLLWIISGLGLGFLFYLQLQRPAIEMVPVYSHNLYPDASFWTSTAFISGFSLATIALFVWIKLIFKSEANDFWILYDRMYKFRATLILKVLTIILAILAIGLIVLGERSKFKIFEDRIEVSRLLSLSNKSYSFEDITELNHKQSFIAPNGDRVLKPYFEVVFKDGSKWNTRMDFRVPLESDKTIFEEISQRTSLEIKVLE